MHLKNSDSLKCLGLYIAKLIRNPSKFYNTVILIYTVNFNTVFNVGTVVYAKRKRYGIFQSFTSCKLIGIVKNLVHDVEKRSCDKNIKKSINKKSFWILRGGA